MLSIACEGQIDIRFDSISPHRPPLTAAEQHDRATVTKDSGCMVVPANQRSEQENEAKNNHAEAAERSGGGGRGPGTCCRCSFFLCSSRTSVQPVGRSIGRSVEPSIGRPGGQEAAGGGGKEKAMGFMVRGGEMGGEPLPMALCKGTYRYSGGSRAFAAHTPSAFNHTARCTGGLAQQLRTARYHVVLI